MSKVETTYSKHREDWCHICGVSSDCVDVFGLASREQNYLRICGHCANIILEVVKTGRTITTNTNTNTRRSKTRITAESNNGGKEVQLI